MLNEILPLTSPEQPTIDLPVATQVQAKATQEIAGEMNLYRVLYTFEVKCPYCSAVFSYEHKCYASMPIRHFAYCIECHRRFVTQYPESAEKKSNRNVSEDQYIKSKDSFRNYHLFHYGKFHYALAGTLGPEADAMWVPLDKNFFLDLIKSVNQSKDNFIIDAVTRNELITKIKKEGLRAVWEKVPWPEVEPKLVCAYKGFNILHYIDRYHALSNELGSVDIRKILKMPMVQIKEKYFEDRNIDHLIEKLTISAKSLRQRR